MDTSPDTTPTKTKRSLAVPVVVGLVLAAIVAACIYYFTGVRPTKPASPADQARWRGYQQEHAGQLSAAQKAFEQHQAMLAAKKAGPPAHKTAGSAR